MGLNESPSGSLAPESLTVEPSRRVLYVEDEDFTRTAVAQSLTVAGFEVHAVSSVAEALDSVEEVDPHALVTDLDLGVGPTGVDLIQHVAQSRPWVGLVILTAHRSVELAVGQARDIPPEVVTVVKSTVDSMGEITQAVDQSISQAVVAPSKTLNDSDEPPILISLVQAEILFLLAEGLSNAGIAERRGTSLRAAEALVQRTLHALGLSSDREYNSRVLAVRLWQSGRVTVR